MITEASVREKLKQVPYPGFSRDIVSFGLVKRVDVSGNDVTVLVSLATRDPAVPRAIHQGIEEAMQSLDGVGKVVIDFDLKDPPEPVAGNPSAAQTSIPGVKRVIAVASGKGGVGKSTVSTNLAIALSRTGAKVGLCDCDLYGPSIALMLGAGDQQPLATEQNEIVPIEAHGIKAISMGFLLGEDSPVIVRGPLATRYTQQFLRQCLWGELDYLVLDLPPGTGDIQLTIVQTVALSGSLIVTTPQEVALIDARKAASMFRKVNVPITGIVENMAWFECEHGTKYPIFGEGGGADEAARLGVPLLAQIPIDIATRDRADRGEPIATLDPSTNAISAAFAELARRVMTAVG
ncbi:MAG: ATP-binding protein [Verrucomicrobia bacterium]|jgi:ATP-binding protein involved in chromosome partitioning|nr:ATP-binding protein [Verrucomicrobiota bacterium]